jgi:hypothetical protein
VAIVAVVCVSRPYFGDLFCINLRNRYDIKVERIRWATVMTMGDCGHGRDVADTVEPARDVPNVCAICEGARPVTNLPAISRQRPARFSRPWP